jgi:hypothetical protein
MKKLIAFPGPAGVYRWCFKYLLSLGFQSAHNLSMKKNKKSPPKQKKWLNKSLGSKRGLNKKKTLAPQIAGFYFLKHHLALAIAGNRAGLT